MKRVLVALLLLISSARAFAAERPVFQVISPKPEQRVEVDIGMMQIHTHNANYRVAWLPFLAPLPYSYPRTTMEVPNPLVLTAAEMPTPPHTRPPEAGVTSWRH